LVYQYRPPFVAQIFERKWDRPIDGQYILRDGLPLFGSHKTIRGLLAGIAAGYTCGLAMGFPWWLGLGTAVLSMGGDLFSSFLKRRLSFISGDVVPGLDQIPEGIFPFLLLAPYFSLSFGYVLAFVSSRDRRYFGSIFLNQVLMESPSRPTPQGAPQTRFRELISCQIIAKPFTTTSISGRRFITYLYENPFSSFWDLRTRPKKRPHHEVRTLSRISQSPARLRRL